MDRIRQCADISIRRGCGFGVLAIWTAMVGMSHDLVLAARGGALMFTLMIVILLLKAHKAPTRRYRDTEVWIMLDGKPGLPESRLQGAIGGILRERYLWHAEVTAIATVILWIVAFVIGWLH
jgi:hypothetical protein